MEALTNNGAGSEALEIDWLGELACQRIRDSVDRIAEMRRQAEDRDDIAGVTVLLRTLSLVAAQSQSLVQVNLSRASKAAEPQRAHLLDTVRSTVLHLENVFGRSCEALVSPPERDVAALVQPYVRLARDITGNRDAELIFESGEVYGYGVWADVFEDVRAGVGVLAPSLETTVEDLPPLALVTYPGRADRETLLHAVIAHEVTHIAIAKDRAEDDSPISSAFEAEVDRFRQGGGSITEREIKRLDLWLNEFLADAMALQIVGPAFFFGLLEYLLPTQMADPHYEEQRDVEERLAELEGDAEEDEDEYELSHPPSSWRLERLKPAAEEFFSSEEGRLGEAAVTFAKFLELAPEPAAREEGSVEERDHDLLIDVLKKIDLAKVVGEATYSAKRFHSDIPLVWDKLEQDIAPVERVKGRAVKGGPSEDARGPAGELQLPETDWSQAIDWRSILNGGYLHFLHGAMVAAPAADGDEKRRRDRQYVNSLIRGAIELSELHRRMIELSAQFDVLNDPVPQA